MSDADPYPLIPFPDLIAAAFGGLKGLDIVDIGCGTGRVTRDLAALGAQTIGVDPNAEALDQARALGGGAAYVLGSGEATGLPTGSADIALFSNSLHHAEDMPAALTEARRLLRRGGRLAVIEPEPHGPTYEATRFLDDEAAVYAAAQAALDAVAAAPGAARSATIQFSVLYRTDSADALIADMTAIDDRRAPSADALAATRAAFAEQACRDVEGAYLEWRQRLDVVRFDA